MKFLLVFLNQHQTNHQNNNFLKFAAPGVPAKIDPKNDYILGSKNADFFILEYSDLECPFCKEYHQNVVKEVSDDFIKTGKVAFVFRQFPIAKPLASKNLHPTSIEEAKATECIGQLAGDKKYYEFISLMFELSSSDGHFNTSALPEIVKKFGVDKVKWQACMDNEKTFNKIENSFGEGVNAGVQGTPTVFVIGSDGIATKIPPQALNIDVIKTIIKKYS